MHEVLGHRNDNDVQQYCKLMGIDDRNAISSKQCTTCAVTKSTRHSVSKHAERTQVPGERIHADIVDWTADSPTGKRYSLVIVDEGSKLLHAVHLNAKKDAVAAFQSFLRETKLPISPTTTALQTDSDAIFLGADFQAIVKKHLKQHQQSPPYTQAQNGIVERQVRTLSDMVRAMITGAGLDASYWSLACNHALHILNNMPRPSLHGKTPLQIVTGSLPKHVPQLHVFGQPAVVHISTQRGRLQPKGRRGIYVGHNSSSNSHLVYFADTNTVVSSIHVRFLPFSKADDVVDEAEEQVQTSTTSSMLQLPSARDSSNSTTDGAFTASSSDDTSLTEPASIKQALKSQQRKQWTQACLEEIGAMERNGVIKLIPRSVVPRQHTPLKSRLVFKVKRDAEGAPTRFKARWVAKGFSQRPGIDFDQTYAPTPAAKTILTVLAVSLQRQHQLHQLDFKSAYLQADLKEELYMELPPHFTDIGDGAQRYAGKVCRLLKPLYGLKQAGRAWAKKLHTFLKTNGWAQSNVDACLFTKLHDDGQRTWIITYVDDLIISGSSERHIRACKQQIKESFEAEDLGPLTCRTGTRKHQLDLVCYSDASFGTDQLTGRSTTGFTCYINGCLVSWSSRLQPTVALSTAEAEYMAISAAAQDVVFLRQLLMDLDEPEAGATKMLTDNQAAIAIGNDHVTKPRTKHIRVRHHFVRELIADGTIVLQHCPGTQMVADALTKALDKQTFEQHLPRLVGTSTAEAEQRKAVEGEC
ncbi:hypothetical protein PTSG_12005 [Salpingoeca rosetta]|uniref:Integrase catalytic domain-containing protein n=1 Tax=Salpingoeca rosetta (strain ATCC 50818 / BSB-021) TaxID=946362 RepID=F2U4Z5_SALR5|nr:uncharacterized protein PTSG_12005 [Salpingoeca rosetta]EGD82711.1 hypothetical protein PTSG_12005 [Salpingoeca rosetta]|eukprot:XP_004995947.1 hypothetical protein PTSG_12005 [Salpingoeca rosetta]